MFALFSLYWLERPSIATLKSSSLISLFLNFSIKLFALKAVTSERSDNSSIFLISLSERLLYISFPFLILSLTLDSAFFISLSSANLTSSSLEEL